MTNTPSEVGKVVRIELDEDTGVVRLVMEITDPEFRQKVIYGKEYKDIVSIKGKSVQTMKVASKSNISKE